MHAKCDVAGPVPRAGSTGSRRPRRARWIRSRLGLGLALAAVMVGGCTGKSRSGAAGAQPEQNAPAKGASKSCDTTPTAAERSPGVPETLRRAEPWIAAAGDDADAVLLTPEQIEALNARHAQVADSVRDPRDPAVAEPATVQAHLSERERWLADKLAQGDYVEGKPGAFDRARRVQAAAEPVDELRLVANESALWCVPTEDGLYTPARDVAFDRNRCTGLHAGELVRVLRRDADSDWHYVHAGHSLGWLHAPAWTPALDREAVDAFVDPKRRGVIVRDEVSARPRGDTSSASPEPVPLRLGQAFPLVTGPDSAAGAQLLVPTQSGLQLAAVQGDAVHQGYLPLTRRRFFELAFSELDSPYGWGGYRGGRDCSRYVHDLLGAFGVRMARNSAVQAQLGNEQVELAGLSEAEKLAAIEAAHARGLVLLYMRGHIMIYLGQHQGTPYALSSLSEYLEPCPTDPDGGGGGERVWRLDRVEVTTLELGRDTARTAFIERLERAVVFGAAPK